MKIFKNNILLRPFNGEMDKIEHHLLQTVDFNCPRCGNRFKFTEAIISSYMDKELKYIIEKFNKSLKLIDEAIIECYGEDVRSELLCRKITKIRSDMLKPNIYIVKSKEDKDV